MWLAYWSSANVTTDEQRDFYIGIYGGIGLGQGVFNLLISITITIGSMVASRRLHHGLLVNIMHSPMSFFDTTPLGRVVNRFSKDLYTIDDSIPRAMTDFLWCIFDVIGMIVAISYATPLFLATLPVLGAFYFVIQVSEVNHNEKCRSFSLIFVQHTFSGLNGREDSVSSHLQTPRVENTTHSGVFLTKFEVFGNAMKHCLDCLIYLLNRN